MHCFGVSHHSNFNCSVGQRSALLREPGAYAFLCVATAKLLFRRDRHYFWHGISYTFTNSSFFQTWASTENTTFRLGVCLYRMLATKLTPAILSEIYLWLSLLCNSPLCRMDDYLDSGNLHWLDFAGVLRTYVGSIWLSPCPMSSFTEDGFPYRHACRDRDDDLSHPRRSFHACSTAGNALIFFSRVWGFCNLYSLSDLIEDFAE